MARRFSTCQRGRVMALSKKPSAANELGLPVEFAAVLESLKSRMQQTQSRARLGRTRLVRIPPLNR